MSSFPGSSRVLKNVIVGIGPFNLLASVVVFQYNPDTITPQTTSGERDKTWRVADQR